MTFCCTGPDRAGSRASIQRLNGAPSLDFPNRIFRCRIKAAPMASDHNFV
jgi:hypothetical protein